MKNIFAKILIMFVCCFALLLFGCSNGQSKPVQKTNSNSTEIKTVEMKNIKSIPNNFVPMNVLDQVIYVPKEFEGGTARQNSEAGLALMGDVWKKVEDPKNKMIEHYSITVAFEKATELKAMKPQEENQVLELIFKNMWNSMIQTAKVATKKEIVSKEICKTIEGHKYLKVVSINGNPNKPHLDMIDRKAIYIFNDTVYFISTNELVRANNKYATEIDNIFNTFGVRK